MKPNEQIELCPICQALGFAGCQGHDEKAGGSWDTRRDDSLEVTLSQEGVLWARSKQDEGVFNYIFAEALLSIRLDLEKGILSLYALKGLLRSESQMMSVFYDEIEKALIAFRNELSAAGEPSAQIQMKRDGGHLYIAIPNQKHYDEFIQRLLDRNLLAMRPSPCVNQKERDAKNKVLVRMEPLRHDIKSTAPTPFSKRPRPKNWEDSKD